MAIFGTIVHRLCPPLAAFYQGILFPILHEVLYPLGKLRMVRQVRTPRHFSSNGSYRQTMAYRTAEASSNRSSWSGRS